MNIRKPILFGICLFIATVLLCLPLANKVEAKGIFQFDEIDPNYLTALSLAAAQEAEEDVDAEEKANLDEDFAPEDFGISKVGRTPDSRLYFLKNWRRGIQSAFTFDQVKETKLKLQYAAEKLLELRAMAEKEEVDIDVFPRALANFREELDNVRARATNASNSAEDEESKELARQMMDMIIKYEKMLGDLEGDIPPALFEHVQEAKDSTSETFGSVFELVNPDEASEDLIKVLDEQKGSDFKHFKNLEVLKEIEEKVPEEAREAIRLVQENSLNRLQNDLENEESKKAIFGDFVKEVGGNEVRHLEIINALEVQPLSETLRESILSAKEEIISKTEDRLAEFVSESLKQRYLGHLNDGELEDVRIVQELKNSLRVEMTTLIDDIAKDAEANFARKLTQIDDKEQEKVMSSIEQYHDAKSIAVLDQMAELIPEDKMEFFLELKQRAADEIQNDIGRARDDSQKEIIYKALAGDHPEQFASFDRFGKETGIAAGIMEGMRNAQYINVFDRIGQIQDKERLAKFETEFEGNEGFIGTKDFGIMQDFFKERKSIFESPEKAFDQIALAEKATAELRGLVDTLPYDKGYDGEFDFAIKDATRMLAHAEKKIEVARVVIDYGDIGRAYGEASAAESIARDGIRIASDYKAGHRKTPEVPEFLPQDFHEVKTTEGKPIFVQPKETYKLFNPYEFKKYCYWVGGFIKAMDVCGLPDGRVFDISEKEWPIEIPPEFIPTKVAPTGPNGPGGPINCPYIYPMGPDFCFGGKVIYDTDDRGCPMPPRCEEGKPYPPQGGYCPDVYVEPCQPGFHHQAIFSERGCIMPGECVLPEELSCGGELNASPCPPGYVCHAPMAEVDMPGKCVLAATCDAYFEGYIYDQERKECSFSSTSGCDNPYVYQTYDECAKANIWTGEEPCPLMPTVSSCPEGQKREVSYSSKKCGTYYHCVPENFSGGCGEWETPGDCGRQTGCQWFYPDTGQPYCGPSVMPYGYCGDGICNGEESKYDCPGDCEGPPNWEQHTWTFRDGLTETSMVLDRTDAEYRSYIDEVGRRCATIDKSQFVWRSGAGDDRPENWQNFGIPDCSGDNQPVLEICGQNKCAPGDYCANQDYGWCCPNGTTICSDGRCESDRSQCGGGDSSTGDENNCPGFAYKSWDTSGKKFCRLNGEEACSYNYPDYLRRSNYRSENCPSTDGTNSGYCGDGTCSSNESSSWCSTDCGLGAYCGDGVCDAAESSGSAPCAADCGSSGGGNTSSMQNCFYPNAMIAETHPGYTVWCERDYYNCHQGDQYGVEVPINGLSLGAPSWCESGWSGDDDGCGNGVCDNGETTESCPSDCGGGGGWGGAHCSDDAYTTSAGQCDYGACPSGCHYDNTGCPFECLPANWPNCPANEFTANPPQAECDFSRCPNGCMFDVRPSSPGCPISCSEGGSGSGWCGDGTCGAGESSGWCSVDCGYGDGSGQYGDCVSYYDESSCSSITNCYWYQDGNTQYCYYSTTGPDNTGGSGGSGTCMGQNDQASCQSVGTHCRWYNLIDGSAYCDDEPHTPSQTSCDNSGTCDASETTDFCPSDCSGGGGGSCGDGSCDSGETMDSCPGDCGYPCGPSTCTSSSYCADYDTGLCCNNGETLCNGACFPSGESCGEQCGSSTCAPGDYCANSSNGWCCPNGMVICDSGECVSSMDQCGGGGGGGEGAPCGEGNTCATGDWCADWDNGWCCPESTSAICPDGQCVSDSSQCSQ